MKKFILISTAFVSLFISTLPVVQAAGATAAISQMATIMHRLKHYPSPQGKQELKQLLSQSSTNEREAVLANAMLNLQHAVSDADKPKLQKLMDDAAASQDEKDLAKIILQLNHRPTDADKEKLSRMQN